MSAEPIRVTGDVGKWLAGLLQECGRNTDSRRCDPGPPIPRSRPTFEEAWKQRHALERQRKAVP